MTYIFTAHSKILNYFYFFSNFYLAGAVIRVYICNTKKTEVVMFKRRFKRMHQVTALNAPATKLY